MAKAATLREGAAVGGRRTSEINGCWGGGEQRHVEATYVVRHFSGVQGKLEKAWKNGLTGGTTSPTRLRLKALKHPEIAIDRVVSGKRPESTKRRENELSEDKEIQVGTRQSSPSISLVGRRIVKKWN